MMISNQYNRNEKAYNTLSRSAAPTQVDTRGQRQRTKQYINSERNEIKQIKKQNPNYVKHRRYDQPHSQKKQSFSPVILFFVVFLVFSLSLLAVYGIATLYVMNKDPDSGWHNDHVGIFGTDDTTKNTGESTNADTSDDTGKGTGTNTDKTPSTDSPQDTLPPSTGSSSTTTKPENNEKDPPRTVYASATPDTVKLGGSVHSSSAILIYLDDHTIVAQKNSGSRIYPASMTKVMTLLVAVENMGSLKDKATVTRITTDYCFREGASIAGFGADETVTVEDLLYGTILPSGADATMTHAEHIAGSEAAFVELMNKKAAELGLTGTHFVNSSGLHDPMHYSTVHDMALILKAAMDNDICFKVLSAKHYVTSKTPQNPNGINLYSIVHTRTKVIDVDGITLVGGKTGYTPEAKNCLATFAITDDGREYILVTADGADKTKPISDAEYIYDAYVPKKGSDVAA